MKKLLIFALLVFIWAGASGQTLEPRYNPFTSKFQWINTDAGGNYSVARDTTFVKYDTIYEYTTNAGVLIEDIHIENGIIDAGTWNGDVITITYIDTANVHNYLHFRIDSLGNILAVGEQHDSTTFTGSYDYITIADGQIVTVGQVDLTADVTGVLPLVNMTGDSTYYSVDMTPVASVATTEGRMYYDSDDNYLKLYDGVQWDTLNLSSIGGGGGDMTKAVYDPGDNGNVDVADTVVGINLATGTLTFSGGHSITITTTGSTTITLPTSGTIATLDDISDTADARIGAGEYAVALGDSANGGVEEHHWVTGYDHVQDLALKANLAGPTFTGTVTIPTPFTIGAVSMTSTGTQLNYLSSATGTTGTTSTNIVFSTSPTLVTPALGTPSALVGTNITGTGAGFTAGAVTGLTLASGSLTLSGADAITLTSTASTNVTLPTSGTLATRAYSAINAQTGTTYEFVAGDVSQFVTFNNASAITVTVPVNADVAIAVGERIDCQQIGAGAVTFTPEGGVTLNAFGSDLTSAGQWAAFQLIKTATDVWSVVGKFD